MPKTYDYIIAVEDLLNAYIYVDTAAIFTELENDIDYLLSLKNAAEENLILLYFCIFNYFKYLKLAALQTNKTINQLTEKDLNIYHNSNIHINVSSKRLTKIISVDSASHQKVLIGFREAVNSCDIFNTNHWRDTDQVYKYAKALYEFIFGKILPQSITRLQHDSYSDEAIINPLKTLAETNFLPACHLLGCYIEVKETLEEIKSRETESEQYLRQAIAANYPLSKIYTAKEYLKFTLNLDNAPRVLSLPIEDMDLTSIICLLREYVSLNFASAIACKRLFLQQLEQLTKASEFVDRDLTGLAQTLDRIETGNETSEISSRAQVLVFITSVKTKLSQLIAIPPQEKFYYLSSVGAQEIERLPQLVEEIKKLQFAICSNIKSLLSSSWSQLFWVAIKINEPLISEYATTNEESKQQQEKFQYLHSCIIKAYGENIPIDKTLGLIAALNDIIIESQQTIKKIAENTRFIQMNSGSSHYYAMRVLAALVKYRKNLAETREYKTPLELTYGIIFYLNQFLQCTNSDNPHKKLEKICLEMALKLLRDESNSAYSLHAEVLFTTLNKIFVNDFDPAKVQQELLETVTIIYSLLNSQLDPKDSKSNPALLSLLLSLEHCKTLLEKWEGSDGTNLHKAEDTLIKALAP